MFPRHSAWKAADSQYFRTISAHFHQAYVQFLNIYFSNAYKHEQEQQFSSKQDTDSALEP